VANSFVKCQKAGADAIQPTVRPDQIAQSYSGYHDDTCSWARTNTATGAPTDDGSCALVQRTNSNFGTVSTSGSVSPAITFTPKRAGKYYVKASFSVTASASSFLSARLTDGTNTIDHVSDVTHSSSVITDFTLTGIVTATNTSAITLSLETSASSGSITIQESASAANTGTSIEWVIFAIENQFPAPLLVNSVVNPKSGVTQIVSARIANAGTPSVSSQDGTWISSITDTGVGDITINITAGTFSDTPRCFCTAIEAAATKRLCQIDDSTAPSSTAQRLSTYDDGGTVRDTDLNIYCVGTR
jgi:hypothetical protein